MLHPLFAQCILVLNTPWKSSTSEGIHFCPTHLEADMTKQSRVTDFLPFQSMTDARLNEEIDIIEAQLRRDPEPACMRGKSLVRRRAQQFRQELERRAQKKPGLLEFCEQCSKNVADWPEWKKAGSDVLKFTRLK